MSIIYLLILKVALSQLSASVDTGSIRGTVIDPSGAPLVGSTVMIIGTSLGAMTGPFGNFDIDNVPVGEYSLRASMVGMGESTIDKVSVTIDEVSNLTFSLTPEGPSNWFFGILIKI